MLIELPMHQRASRSIGRLFRTCSKHFVQDSLCKRCPDVRNVFHVSLTARSINDKASYPKIARLILLEALKFQGLRQIAAFLSIRTRAAGQKFRETWFQIYWSSYWKNARMSQRIYKTSADQTDQNLQSTENWTQRNLDVMPNAFTKRITGPRARYAMNYLTR
jgi:hypothetical protein